MGFKDELREFQRQVVLLQGRECDEQIEHEDAVIALVVLNYIQYKKVPDLFLGCAAMNLLNTYVKQPKAKLNYQFRRHMQSLLKGFEDVNQPKAVRVWHDDKNGMVFLMIVFWNFQFSFHGERMTEAVKNLAQSKVIPWDGIRKQLCAKTIFEFALSDEWLSNLTLNGADLQQVINQERACYHKGGYAFINGQIIKICDIKAAKDESNKYLKNYIRIRLCECQDRPVILIGTFKKVWDKHITFTTIRPYLQGTQTITICDHINLYRPDVEKALDISKLEKDRKYYIIGFCTPYPRSTRMGVKLATGYGFRAIFRIGEFAKMPDTIFSVCHRFGIDEFISNKQTNLKL